MRRRGTGLPTATRGASWGWRERMTAQAREPAEDTMTNAPWGRTDVHSSQWSPGDTPTPAFQTPRRCGTLLLSDRMVPFTPPLDTP